MVLYDQIHFIKLKIDSFYSSCRFNDFNDAVKYFGNNFCEGDCLADLFPLKARISVSLETNSLVLKISQEVRLAFCLLSPEFTLQGIGILLVNSLNSIFYLLRVALHN